ncbi:HD domain-containing protein [Vibrio fluvialis]|nr:HD domain-containing protein [Vibrio fluvialis]
MALLKAHHLDSYKHSIRVAENSFCFAYYLGFSFEHSLKIFNIALLHDIGKIQVPSVILNKKSHLNELELSLVKTHVNLENLDLLEEDIVDIISLGLLHHERWDGKGYPHGLKFSDIPLESQIVSICDTWDAMTCNRIYHKGLKVNYALDILQKEKHLGQFDPILLGRFLSYMRQKIKKAAYPMLG